MKQTPRKTTPKVRDGRVQKKDRHDLTANYWNTPQRIPTFDKEKPGRGHKHFLRKEHIVRFIKLLPDWDELSKNLNAVVLAEGGGPDGYCYEGGVILICAWPRDPDVIFDVDYYRDHADIFGRLGVRATNMGNHYVCRFSDSQVRAYQLLHIFLHELGHHHDHDSDNSEKYAEEYALKYEAQIWDRYIKEFELES